MVSQLHEALLQLFRNRPALAPELLRDALHLELPEYTEVRIDSADITEVQPAEYRADLVVLLFRGVPVHGIIVEVQLSRDERKPFVWPAYVINLRARLRCEVSLLVVTPDESVARWAAKPIYIGGPNWYQPLVMGPSGVPEVTDEAAALADPELAVLSAMAHGQDPDIAKAVRIANAAQFAALTLDADRSPLYVDLVLNALSEAARRALRTMLPFKYEYQSDFARQYFGQGKAEGRAEGTAEGQAALVRAIVRQLNLRFGSVDDAVREKLAAASIAQLDEIGERLMTVETLQEALGTL
jgi:hypothetical protein